MKFQKRYCLAVVMLALVACLTPPVHSNMITLVNQHGKWSEGINRPFVVHGQFENLAPNITSATIEIKLQGDLDYFMEYVDVSVENKSLGRLFNNDSTDDLFSGSTGHREDLHPTTFEKLRDNPNDIGSDFEVHYARYHFTDEEIASFVQEDGILDYTFEFSFDVHENEVEMLDVIYQYTVVPTPQAASLWLAALASSLLATRARRRHQ